MRLGYFTVLITGIVFGLLFLYFSEELVSPLEDLGFADCSGDDKAVCLGVQAVYRVSFTLLVFFVVMVCLTLPGGEMMSLFNSTN